LPRTSELWPVGDYQRSAFPGLFVQQRRL